MKEALALFLWREIEGSNRQCVKQSKCKRFLKHIERNFCCMKAFIEFLNYKEADFNGNLQRF